MQKKGDVCINQGAQYKAEQRTIQILQILKEISDENHSVKQYEILHAMDETGKAKTCNPGTLSNSLDEIILQINPLVYSENKENNYRIKYNGEKYKNSSVSTHLVFVKQKIRKVREKIKNGTANNEDKYLAAIKAPSITDLYYVHDFTYEELDQLMDAINSSSRLSPSDKENLMMKLQQTASKYYESPYYDHHKGKIRFFNTGIYDRLSERQVSKSDAEVISENIRIIQSSIDKGVKIEFKFNDILKDGERVPRKWNGNTQYVLNPYYIVVYHELYYLIGAMEGKSNISHYRIDLISDITEKKNDKIEPMRNINNLPLREEWNPEKYMREHMNMFYGNPISVKFKIKSGNYIMVRDFFGDHYEAHSADEQGYDIVKVKCVAEAMVHFALQYGEDIEVLNEEIREQIKIEIEKLKKMYYK